MGCQKERTVHRKHRVGDIVWSRGVYREHRLVLTMKVREMTTSKSRATYIGNDIATADGGGVYTQILYNQGHVSFDLIGSTDHFRCPGAEARIRTKRQIYVQRIPASCLDRTPWVRLSASTYVSGNHDAWYDVSGLGSDIKLKHEVSEPFFGGRIHRAHQDGYAGVGSTPTC